MQESDILEDLTKISIYNAYRSGKIDKNTYKKYVNDGYPVKTTLISI